MNRSLLTPIILVINILIPTWTFSIEPNWSTYENILKTVITQKKIANIPVAYLNYKKIEQHPKWKQVVFTVQNYSYQKLTTKKQRAAFLINAYNIHIIELIIKQKPSKSILDIKNAFKEKSKQISNQLYSLDEIEVELRKNIDARFHFAIVCAALSCPNLDTTAYKESTLNIHLDRITKEFLKNTQKGVQIDKNTKHIHTSQLFKWYQKDFEINFGSSQKFLKKYLPNLPLSKYTLKADLKYNWNINGKI